MNLLAIDPGASGGIASLIGGHVECVPMPETPKDTYDLLFSAWSDSALGNEPLRCYMEKVGGFIGEGQPGSSAFHFGRNVGLVEGMLIAIKIPFELVTPQRWQKPFGFGSRGTQRIPGYRYTSPEERKLIQTQNAAAKRDWKNKLKEHAQRLFPHANVTLKTADALLILEYARVINSVAPPRNPTEGVYAMKYRIHWTNKSTGQTGFGKDVMELGKAQLLAQELNADYPGFSHEPSPINTDLSSVAQAISKPPVFTPLTDEDPFPFGFWKGKPLKHVPASYLDWLEGQAWAADWPAVMDYIERNRRAISQDLDRKERV